MTPNGPTWPEPTGQPRPPAPSYGPPPQYQPPSQPHDQTQAVPNHVPPSQHQPYQALGTVDNASQGAPQPGNGGNGQRALLAGVLGGLLVLVLVVAIALFLTSDDAGDAPDPQTLVENQPGTDPTGSGGDPAAGFETAAERIGTSVDTFGLLTGDCIDYDRTNTSLRSYDVVSCSAPHLVEISFQAEHPEAGGGFPGVDEVYQWGDDVCRPASGDYLGVDVLSTTFMVSILVPEFDEWSAGLYRVSCLVSAADGAKLIESIQGKGASYPRSSDVVVNGLTAGDCFVLGPDQFADELGLNDTVMLGSCNEPHEGLYFGRAMLASGPASAFPGQESVDAEAIERCNAEFARYFGIEEAGFSYRYWSPDEELWNTGGRTVHCALIDEQGLAIPLTLSAYRPLFSLPIGSCFVNGPDETVADLALDDRVEPVDCATEHNGQLFGSGSLPASNDLFPGTEALDSQVAEECIRLFTDYVGLSPFNSESGDFTYWFPSESGWESGDLRWACALATDTLSVGSIEGTER